MAKRMWLYVVLGTAFSPTALAGGDLNWNDKPVVLGKIGAISDHSIGGFLCEKDQKAKRARQGAKGKANTITPTAIDGNGMPTT